MDNKPKVLILYNKIFHYRIPIWNILAKRCDLTVTYSTPEEENVSGCNFNVIYLPYYNLNRFVIQKANVRKMAKQYDVVIAYGDIAWLKFSTLPWFNKTKVIFWSLGVSASYNSGFDERSTWDKARAFFYSKADALAFYTDYPIKKYIKMGIPKEKMFEAPNTVEVHPIKEKIVKNTILFIGTLYRAKGIQTLLEAYRSLNDDYDLPLLNIIGKGPDYEFIKEWINDNALSEKIHLQGAIYDIDEKAKFFGKALACISPSQAGLSVLESMGYGVPFVTTKNAITGGEIFNVHNGIDGIIMETESELEGILADISKNPSKYINMGKKAQIFYNENRTPQHMADGLWNAIQYAMNH